VDKPRMLNGHKNIRRVDAIIGIASSGLHTNGYSLARRIFFDQMKLKPRSHLAELGATIGDELLKVHVTYGPLVQSLLKHFNPRLNVARTIKAFAHITGGGFVDNIPRVLPKSLGARIDLAKIPVKPVLKWLAHEGGITQAEMLRTFNCGIGMIAVAAAKDADAVMQAFKNAGEQAVMLGEVVPADGGERATYSGQLELG